MVVRCGGDIMLFILQFICVWLIEYLDVTALPGRSIFSANLHSLGSGVLIRKRN